MVGSWAHSSSRRWYDSSHRPVEPAAGDHTEEAKDPSVPVLLLGKPGPCAMAFCVNMLMEEACACAREQRALFQSERLLPTGAR